MLRFPSRLALSVEAGPTHPLRPMRLVIGAR